jgi:gluconate 5-dehydrogenase
VSFKLDGKVALITGGARGLGFEMAGALGEAGAIVYVNGSDKLRAEAAVEQLRVVNIRAHAAVFDVSNEAAASAALEKIFATHGRFDILVNNVGIRMRESLDDIGALELHRMLDVNLVAAFTLSKQAATLMKRGDYGRLINVSSVAALRGRPGDAAYIIVKGAMNSMTRALAAEYGEQGITCNAILPGPFSTETNAQLFRTPAVAALFERTIILRRAGEPHEIRGAAVFFASPSASFVTGVCLPVDGGYLAKG